MKVFRAESLEELQVAAVEISQLIRGGVWRFDGEMGAGKTTLIKALCAAWDCQDKVTSPTFSLVNEYRLPSGSAIYHFDFYRIENPIEALDMGVEEYFDSGDICLVEWPERIADYLPDNSGKISIEVREESRRITMEEPF